MKSLLQTIQYNLRKGAPGMLALGILLMLAHGQASAQNYKSPAQAMATIGQTLPVLTAAPTKAGGNQGSPVLTNNGAPESTVASTTSSQQIVNIKYLDGVGRQIKGGLTTGTAIEAVHDNLVSLAGSNPNASTMIETARTYVIGLLSN